jgi:hypothetical protein
MAWPEALIQLLALSDSPAALSLRCGLRGLRTSLQAMLDEVPEDPGRGQVQALVTDLEILIDRNGSSAAALLMPNAQCLMPPLAAPGEQSAADDSESLSPGPHLMTLATALAKDGRIAERLARNPIPTDSDAAIWSAIQQMLLYVSPHLAEEWHSRAQQVAEENGGRLDEWAAVVLPLAQDEAVYAGVTGEIRAPGLRSAPTAALDPRVGPPVDAHWRTLAGITSSFLWFCENGVHLHHCLKTVFRFGIAPLVGEQRERFVAELLRRWERVKSAADTSPDSGDSRVQLKDRLKALLDLDEALHCLLPLPPASTDSWWGRLLGQVRETLFQARNQAVQAGCTVHLQLLGGSFADLNRLAPDSLQVDFGVPGEISACLRVWARIDGEEIKGRVLYRSPTEEA